MKYLDTLARCRWCDKNDVPIDEMGIFSWKPSIAMFTGVCKKCMDDPEAEARYHERMLSAHSFEQ